MPDGVSYIGSNAFKNCSALSQIEIPKSVRDIVANAFDGTKWYEDRKHEMIYINDLLYRVPTEIIVQSEQPTGSLSDKDAAELAKSGVATQIIPYTDVIVQEKLQRSVHLHLLIRQFRKYSCHQHLRRFAMVHSKIVLH